MEPRYFPRYSSSRRATMIDPDEESDDNSSAALPTITTRRRSTNSSSSSVHSRPKPLHTPNKAISPFHNLHPSAPASPPTPAPSPAPHQRAPSWQSAGEDEDTFLRDARQHFSLLGRAEGQRFLAEILNLCDNQQLSFVYHFVSPRLKKDPFKVLPNELCLRILSFIDDPKTLARASQVSIRWHELLNDDMTWKLLCDNHAYRTMSEDTQEDSEPFSFTLPPNPYDPRFAQRPWQSSDGPSARNNSRATTPTTSRAPSSLGNHSRKRRAKTKSYRSHFKQRYMVEAAWRKGGHVFTKHITPDHGVVTSLHLTSKYIAVALDNAKIHIFNTTGEHQRTLQGHVMGVWAMVPWDDILVSGGCDRDVRVWNMATGENIHKLRGHTSTVRCLKMSNATTAISGSRDTTLRIWDLAKGVCKNVLVGHQASVRCLGIHGDLVVSGSYDTTAKIWNISEGRCLRTLAGHFSQIYAIAFDGKRIATGSLDTSVRIWDPQTGQCHAILQGHTSLVGQLQMRGDTLVTGGSDGSVRVWSLLRMAAIHRLAAHDNSITSLQFDDNRIVSGGSDGRVKIWNLRTGQLVRELSQPAEAVWRVAFEDEKAVVMATRAGRTIMEVWSFAPPDDAFDDPGSDSDSQSSTAELGFSNISSNTHHQFNDPHHCHHHRNDNTHNHASSSSVAEAESSSSLSSSSSPSSSVAVISPPPAEATEPVPTASHNSIQDLEMQDAFTDVSSSADANGR
ncbi:F-box and WD-40 domain-containing protein CDC4 [Blastomyces dermatitidis ATCC 18188]|uniref:Probable E3 ubiquitin ligase complex SCF subunit sconB n=1 Tax=Ajellomyces dermatitidis (strain ATCC 18188 / CBS 674.68) TaxID=653446 RepID=F2T3F7_AJEDA|nr:F-box and WD-40 domain-containing protein CDC4 [Blastomyces dermatitidis ATCC 18188]